MPSFASLSRDLGRRVGQLRRRPSRSRSTRGSAWRARRRRCRRRSSRRRPRGPARYSRPCCGPFDSAWSASAAESRRRAASARRGSTLHPLLAVERSPTRAEQVAEVHVDGAVDDPLLDRCRATGTSSVSWPVLPSPAVTPSPWIVTLLARRRRRSTSIAKRLDSAACVLLDRGLQRLDRHRGAGRRCHRRRTPRARDRQRDHDPALSVHRRSHRALRPSTGRSPYARVGRPGRAPHLGRSTCWCERAAVLRSRPCHPCRACHRACRRQRPPARACRR